MKKIRFLAAVLPVLLLLSGCNRNTVEPVIFDLETVEINYDGEISSGMEPCQQAGPIKNSYVTKKLGRNGLIVAGYAPGPRKSYYRARGNLCHVSTTFVVTDVYRGKVRSETITVREPYALFSKGDQQYFVTDYNHSYSVNQGKLVNDVPVLLFLYKYQGAYRPVCSPLPLMPDYNQFSDDYVESLCDFYRGDPSAYHSETGFWEIRDPQNQNYDAQHYVRMWPERALSNEAVAEEFSENLLIQTALKYKIALWPYGHRNYDPNGWPNDVLRDCSNYRPEDPITGPEIQKAMEP